jgi:chemotaxis signal transduction protein
LEYYKILGVEKTATAEEIKRAYRRLAREHHPDLNPGSNSANHFIRIKNAYDILHDPAKRQNYDDSSCYVKPPRQGKDPFARKAKEDPVKAAESKTTQVLAFFLGEEEYALKISDILGISGCASMKPPEAENSCIEGMVHVRGENLPVIDLASNFGFVPANNAQARFIIQVEIEKIKVGLMVGSQPQMVVIPNEMISSMPDSPTGKAVNYMQVGRLNERMIFIFELDQVLSPLTLAVLKDLARGA